MHGIDSPCPDDTVDSNAPVAANSTRLYCPAAIFVKMYELSTTALHPAPLPP